MSHGIFLADIGCRERKYELRQGLAMTLTFDLNTLLRVIAYKPLTTWHFVKYKLNGTKGTENML